MKRVAEVINQEVVTAVPPEVMVQTTTVVPKDLTALLAELEDV
jgi:hypothetical protein